MIFDLEFLAQHVQTLRKARGMTPEVLAGRSDLPVDTIRGIERATVSPTLTELEKLCKGLEVQVPAFLDALELGES